MKFATPDGTGGKFSHLFFKKGEWYPVYPVQTYYASRRKRKPSWMNDENSFATITEDKAITLCIYKRDGMLDGGNWIVREVK